MFGIYLFLESKTRIYLLIFSALSFGFSLYSYDAPKIFLPPFFLLIFYFQKEFLFKFKKYFSIFTLIFLVFYISILNITFLHGGLEHFSRASIFNSIPDNVDSERFQTNAPLWLSSIFHNKLTVALKRFETSYVSIFSINWFFINGSGNLQHAVGNHGEFYFFELPFFFIGLYIAFKKSKRLGFFLLGWMMLGALPGGLTDGNYAYRSVLLLPVPIIFSSLGIAWFWDLRSKKLIQLATRSILLTIMAIYIISYLHTYFFDYPVYASEYWNKQQNEALRFISANKNKYKSVFVDGGEPWAINYALFNKVDPKIYQNAYRNQEIFNRIRVMKIDNVYFGIYQLQYVSNPSNFFPKNSMIVTNATNFPNKKYLKSFKDPGNIRDIFKVFAIE